ncbi:MAG TPA: DUF4418 family protein [Anaeromyxobacter sp.]
MRKLVAATDLGAGLLLLAVPRFVFPPCGWVGRPAMHCTTTAWAEIGIGVALLAAGALALLSARRRLVQASVWASFALLLAAGAAPSVYGYCASPKMACHYGMAPTVRFVAAVAVAVLLAAMALARRPVEGEERSA